MKKLVLSTLFLVACGGMPSNVVSPKVVQAKAASDLSCPEATVEAVGNTSWKATGCGKTASYTCWTSPGMGEGTCTKEP